MEIGRGNSLSSSRNRLMSMSHHLPHEMEEAILTRLPVRSVLRFQAVSKSWKSIIWTPFFAKMRAKVSLHFPLVIFLMRRRESNESIEFCLTDNRRVIIRAVYEASFLGVDYKPYCSCNGVVLLEGTTSNSSMKSYILLNPVTGMYKEIVCPYDGRKYCGLCSDPALDDFKILIVCEDTYFTYSCRNDIWSEKREFIYSNIGYKCLLGYKYLNGGFYMARQGNEAHELYIVSFDSRDDTFIMLTKIEGDGTMNPSGLFMIEWWNGHLSIGKKPVAGEIITLCTWELEGRSWIKKIHKRIPTGDGDRIQASRWSNQVFPPGWVDCLSLPRVRDTIFFPFESGSQFERASLLCSS